MTIDIARLKRDNALSEVIGRVIKLRRDGHEYRALCPWHRESTPSFSVSDEKGFYHCFGCGAHGDLFDFVMRYHGVALPEAAKLIDDDAGERRKPISERTQNVMRRTDEDDYADLEAHAIAEDDLPKRNRLVTLWNPKRRKWWRAKPSLVHVYRDDTGGPIGCVLRIETEDGKKITPTIRYAKFRRDAFAVDNNDKRTPITSGTIAWALWPFERPRPLYGLELLDVVGEVLIVEGEKCSDAARHLGFENVIAWPQGTNGAPHVDWTPLAGRDLLLWPDNDQPGLQAMLGRTDEYGRRHPGVAELAHAAKAASIRVLPLLPDRPEAFDVADWEKEDASTDAIRQWIDLAATAWIPGDAPVRDDRDPGEDRGSESGEGWPPGDPGYERGPPDDGGSGPGEDGGSGPGADTLRPTAQEQPAEAEVTTIKGRKVAIKDVWREGLVFKEGDTLYPTAIQNGVLYMKHFPPLAGVFSLDEFAQRIIVTKKPPWMNGHDVWRTRPIEDTDGVLATGYLEQQNIRLGTGEVFHAIMAAARSNGFHPVRAFFSGLEWDGHPRIDTWLTYYLGAEDTPYTRAIGAKWLIGGIARVFKPGCQMDNMLILEGEQDIGKSSSLRILATLGGQEYFTDEIHDIGSKDASLQLQGVLLVELAELASLNKSEVNAIKAWLTRRTDRFRPPFARTVSDFPRQCIIAGTLNPDGNGYLQDATGARRFWPVTVLAVDFEALVRDRDQLWAEAMWRHQQQERWWLEEHEEREGAKAAQSDRYMEDAWADAIDRMIEGQDSIRTEDIFSALSLSNDKRDARALQRITKHLVNRGFRRKKMRTASLGGKPKWSYCREGPAA